MRCEHCHAEKLVAFSCKKRGFCPSCGARRMVETAALLADEVLPERPLRQWVLSLPALRFLLATDPQALNLNVHLHMLFLDGVYVADGTGSPGRAKAARWMICWALRSPTALPLAREPVRSCSRCRRCQPDRRSGWTIPTAWYGRAGSPCTPAST
ncbi:MAG: hypothetical protein AMXMBFR8_30490 [Nevskiales bacterium]